MIDRRKQEIRYAGQHCKNREVLSKKTKKSLEPKVLGKEDSGNITVLHETLKIKLHGT